MKLIFDDLPTENYVDSEGSVKFIIDGYLYYSGEFDGISWLSRIHVNDYYNEQDNWERVGNWVPENTPVFKLLRGKKTSL
jgi:hypothetical protein